jgi:hypothetical protein
MMRKFTNLKMFAMFTVNVPVLTDKFTTYHSLTCMIRPWLSRSRPNSELPLRHFLPGTHVNNSLKFT